MVIGSHNLTAGGLWTNFGAQVLIPVVGSEANEGALLKGLDEYIEEICPHSKTHSCR